MTTLLLLGALSAPALAGDDIPLVLVEAAYTDASLEAALTSADWQVRHDAGVAALWRDDPGLAADLWAVQPQTTRAGFLRFWGGVVDQPRAEHVLLERLIHGGEDAGTRHALVDAIARSGADYDQAYVALMPSEVDGWVRAAFVHSLRKQDSAQAFPMFRLALVDSDAYVRAEGARSVAYHPQGQALAVDVMAVLDDGDAQVRAAAVRSLGVLRVEEGFEGAAALLGDADAEVRLQALHAVERIDAERAAGFATGLLDDSDARVARLAVRVSER